MSGHPRLSVHAVCFPDAGVPELIGLVGATGARRLSLHSGQFAGADLPALRAQLDAAGLGVETVTHMVRAGALDRDPAQLDADRARLRAACRVAATLGARSIYMLTGGRGALDWEEAADLFAELVAPCLADARAGGLALAIENTTPFFAHGHLATNLRDTIALAEHADLGVCIDHFACWTEAGLPDLFRRAAPRLVLVQVSDYVLGDRTLPCRAVPGDGAIPWARVLGWLREAGYRGGFDLELIGPRIDAEGPPAAIARAVRTTTALLDAAGF